MCSRSIHLVDYSTGLVVSDSEPLEPDVLCICSKLEVRINGESRSLNLSRICIRLGTEIHFDVTVDQTVLPITEEKLMHAVSVFDEVYQRCFLDEYDTDEALTGDEVFFGGGAGFV